VFIARRGEGFHPGTPSELVTALHREGVRRVYVDGGATIRSFLGAGRVDDLTVSLV
jgi:riboflavin biosynthesis pyrimidine reductase